MNSAVSWSETVSGDCVHLIWAAFTPGSIHVSSFVLRRTTTHLVKTLRGLAFVRHPMVIVMCGTR